MQYTYAGTSRTIATASWNIHVNEAGPADAPVVVLLHGSGPGATGWSNFSENIPALAERYRVIAADMPGWGESSACTWQERNHPAAVAELLDALGVASASLIGNSMGGGTAVRFAYEYPDRIDKLITMYDSEAEAVKAIIKHENQKELAGDAPVDQEKVLITFTDEIRNKMIGGKKTLLGTMSNVDGHKVQFVWNGKKAGISADQAKQLFFAGSDVNLKFQVKMIKKRDRKSVV